MPKRVPDITVQQAFVGDEHILGILPNDDLRLFPTNSFRGAGIYTGDIAPTELHPNNENGALFMNGDMYIQRGASVEFFLWDQTLAVGSRWVSEGNILGTLIHDLTGPGRVANDVIYAGGDWAMLDSQMFGPYVVAAASDELAWPLYISLAQSSAFILNRLVGEANAVPTDPLHADFGGVVPAAGDTFTVRRLDIPTGSVKTQLYQLTNSIDPLQWDDLGYMSGPRLWTLGVNDGDDITTEGWPRQEDQIFKTGDTIISEDGVTWGPYVEGTADNRTSWPVLHISSPIRWTIDIASNGVPPQHQAYRAGDTVLADVLGSTTGKQYLFDVVANTLGAVYLDPANFAYNNRRNPNPTRIFTPVDTVFAHNEDNFSAGDLFQNVDGTINGPFVEGAPDIATAWPLLTVPTHAIVIDQANGLTYRLLSVNGVPFLEEL